MFALGRCERLTPFWFSSKWSFLVWGWKYLCLFSFSAEKLCTFVHRRISDHPVCVQISGEIGSWANPGKLMELNVSELGVVFHTLGVCCRRVLLPLAKISLLEWFCLWTSARSPSAASLAGLGLMAWSVSPGFSQTWRWTTRTGNFASRNFFSPAGWVQSEIPVSVGRQGEPFDRQGPV